MSGIILPNSGIQQGKIAQINPLEFDDYTCKCGCKIYIEKIITKKVPLFYQGTIGTDVMDFRYLVCDECGELHEVFAKEPTFQKLLDK